MRRCRQRSIVTRISINKSIGAARRLGESIGNPSGLGLTTVGIMKFQYFSKEEGYFTGVHRHWAIEQLCSRTVVQGRIIVQLWNYTVV